MQISEEALKLNKAKRQAWHFINYLFDKYKVQRIPVYIHWYHPSLETEDGMISFGLFMYGYEKGKENPCIHIAGKQIGGTGICSVFAHEFTHYLQWLHGRDMDNIESVEEDAEYMGAGLYGQFLTNKKDKKIRIDGCLNAWKTKAEMEA